MDAAINVQDTRRIIVYRSKDSNRGMTLTGSEFTMKSDHDTEMVMAVLKSLEFDTYFVDEENVDKLKQQMLSAAEALGGTVVSDEQLRADEWS